MQSLNLAINSPSKNYKVHLMVTGIVLQHQQLQKPWCIRLCISNHNKVWGYSVCWHGELQNSSTRNCGTAIIHMIAYETTWLSYWGNIWPAVVKHEKRKKTLLRLQWSLVESNTGWNSQACAEELYTLKGRLHDVITSDVIHQHRKHKS